MSAYDLNTLAEAAMDIAQSAGREILSIYAAGFEVETKADESPLTTADNAAHAIIQERLTALTPAIPVLSEEGGMPDYSERKHWPRYWLVDPLDGTREFIKQNGEFTVNIALIEGHKAVLGVVHAPVLNRSYIGVAMPSSMQSPGQDTQVPQSWAQRRDTQGTKLLRCRSVPPTINTETPLKLVVSRSHRSPAVDAFLEHLPAFETLSMGSSLKFCLIAEGSADCYPRLGPTSEWDSAAAQCIVEAAGGAVTKPNGQPLRYNTKASILNPNFIVLGDPSWGWDRHIERLPVEER